MLTDSKVSSLACKFVYYRLENNAKGGWGELSFEGPEIQK